MTDPSGVRLKTNVLCVRLETDDPKCPLTRKPEELRHQLSYFELCAIRRARPLLYHRHWTDDDQLTPRQRLNRDAFLTDYREPPWSPILEGFVPYTPKAEG
jgi:hypothetical protein